MSEEKFCPLKYTFKHGLEHCSKEKCAWWIDVVQCCVIIVIGKDIALSQVGKR